MAEETTFERTLRRNHGLVYTNKYSLDVWTREPRTTPPPQIPPQDMEIIRKIYFKEYEDAGRKRGALMRYIKYFREKYEVPPATEPLIRGLQKIQRKIKHET